ncbi:TlpA disulfide reductase family protein [Bdellovibrionota bacterium FG-2]
MIESRFKPLGCFFKIIAFSGVLSSCTPTSTTPPGGYSLKEQVAVSRVSLAPAFELKDFKGKAFHLKDFKGTATVVHFWASWCPPCQVELPKWLALVSAFKGKPVKFVAITVDEEWALAHKLLPEKSIPEGLVSLIDMTSEVSRKFGTTQFPETYLLDRELHIVKKWSGAEDWKSAYTLELIQKAMK